MASRGLCKLRSALYPPPPHLQQIQNKRILLPFHHRHLQQHSRSFESAASGSARKTTSAAVSGIESLFYHHQLQHPRSFAAAAAAAAAQKTTTAPGSEETAKKRRRSKKKNFIEVAQFLPNWGIGAKFTKSHWPQGNFYRVTNVKLYKSGRHGAAWGVFHQSEAPKTDEVQKIGGVNKRCWRYVPERGVDGAAETAWKRIVSFRPVVASSTAASDSASSLDPPAPEPSTS